MELRHGVVEGERGSGSCLQCGVCTGEVAALRPAHGPFVGGRGGSRWPWQRGGTAEDRPSVGHTRHRGFDLRRLPDHCAE